ncbi:MAG: tRNA pseudouridine synthase A [Planctomycetes bacterium]|nr:tRNA pseudouridine synthase A [Planctomycetota bacterium]
MTVTPAREEAGRRLVRAARDPAKDAPPPLGDAPRRFRARVAYDGSAYAGWQRQHDRVSVQEMLECALERATGEAVSVSASGRTDAGVHAEGQVVAFDSRTLLPPKALKHLCDHVLPPDVRVLRCDEAPEGFDPQRDAVRKLYRYAILPLPDPSPARERCAWRIAGPLDAARMRDAAARLVGTRDFRAFRNDPGPERRGEDTVRTVFRLDVLDAREAAGLVHVEAEGTGFLYRMVRNLAAALAAVGRGERPPEWAEDVLRSRDRARLPPPAPPEGLTLVRVDYPDGW